MIDRHTLPYIYCLIAIFVILKVLQSMGINL
jgi:hypothetical protein